MNLIDTSNTGVSLIQIIFTNPSIIGMIVYFILLSIVLGFIAMRQIEINSVFESIMVGVTVFVIFIGVVTMPIGFAGKSPTYTYQGDAKVLQVDPKDEEGKQDITLKNGKDSRKISVYSKDEPKNLQKDDNVSVRTTYKQNPKLFEIIKPFYMNDNGEPRKHIKFKDMIFSEDVKIIKK